MVRPDSIVERRFIEIGPEVGKSTIVERGLAKGEKIVVEGYHKLSHSMKVNPVPVPESGDSSETQLSKGSATTVVEKHGADSTETATAKKN